MAKLIGAQRMVLQAILELPKDSTGFSMDAQISQNTQIALEDVRNWLETLEGEDYVNVARTEVGLRASITAQGRLALKQYQFQRAPAIVPPKERPPSWFAKAVAWVTISALLFSALGWVAWLSFWPKPPVKVDVTVEHPVATLPLPTTVCQVAPRAKFKMIHDKIVADRIERVFSDDPKLQVVFLLIEKKKDRHDEPVPFYIMENKVWNGLFARFAEERPEAVQDSKWKSSLKGDPRAPENVWLPVMNVTAKEAQEFAYWLGGRLPSCMQWDKAAGVYDRGGRMGPFEGTWVPGQKDRRIAVGRKDDVSPVPVNREDITDISIFGVRDMAGNGLEWTRDENAGIRILRGWRFTKDYPWKFEFLDDKRIEVAVPTSSDKETGFRVVLEPDL